METSQREALEDAYEMNSRVIKASEAWGKSYDKDPESHAKLIKMEAKLERVLRKYFRDLADSRDSFISWYGYQRLKNTVQAADDGFNVDVIINDDAIDGTNGLFLTVVFDEIATGVALGAQAGEVIYKVPLGLDSTSAIIQQTARKQIAELVGKRIDKAGNIVDNPRASYRISDKTRADIRESIRTSLSLGEDQATASERLRKVIINPKRAEIIAKTETVNAYGGGLLTFGSQSGATGKYNDDVMATDICRTNSEAGIIPLDADFPSGHQKPSFHTGCRCSMGLDYGNA